MRNHSFCQICGKRTKEYGRRFCGVKCYNTSRKGVQPAHFKKKPQPTNISDIEDGSVDAGLLLMSITPKPDGGQWSSKDVARVCGVSGTYIRMLEQSAMRKLRAAFMARQQELADFL